MNCLVSKTVYVNVTSKWLFVNAKHLWDNCGVIFDAVLASFFTVSLSYSSLVLVCFLFGVPFKLMSCS